MYWYPGTSLNTPQAFSFSLLFLWSGNNPPKMTSPCTSMPPKKWRILSVTNAKYECCYAWYSGHSNMLIDMCSIRAPIFINFFIVRVGGYDVIRWISAAKHALMNGNISNSTTYQFLPKYESWYACDMWAILVY
jgi:hypothetical protein